MTIFNYRQNVLSYESKDTFVILSDKQKIGHIQFNIISFIDSSFKKMFAGFGYLIAFEM